VPGLLHLDTLGHVLAEGPDWMIYPGMVAARTSANPGVLTALALNRDLPAAMMASTLHVAGLSVSARAPAVAAERERSIVQAMGTGKLEHAM